MPQDENPGLPPSQRPVPALRCLTEAVLDFSAPEELSDGCHHMRSSREDGQESHPDCRYPKSRETRDHYFLLLFWDGFLQSNR